jgi:GNAT superfamily N-acetyltransferase
MAIPAIFDSGIPVAKPFISGILASDVRLHKALNPIMTHRRATADDCPVLAALNHQLIRDEAHRNLMTVAELEDRMRAWLAGDYIALLFEEGREVVAYCLYRESTSEIYLRQLFVVRDRRRQGIGRAAMQVLMGVWPKNKRLTVDVLVKNEAALAFWRAVGYRDYCLTLEILPEGSASK